MPQLNPAPWFMILVFSWTIFLTILPPKVMAHVFSYDPTAQNTDASKAHAWTWPW